MDKELFYQLALLHIEGLGPRTIKSLLDFYGSAQAIFNKKSKELQGQFGIGKFLAESIINFSEFQKCHDELNFIQKHQISVCASKDEAYPYRLKHIPDLPSLLFFKGPILDHRIKMLSIVGTRRPNSLADRWVNDVIRDLAELNVCIVSGLAHGVDQMAHAAAIRQGLPTIAVLAHGLDRIYPQKHYALSREILNSGGILMTEFRSGTQPNRENFPKRNRIVAGMSEAVLVVQSNERGGSLITADLAFQYDRAVFALPGRWSDDESAGCNALIKENKAQLVTSATDIVEALNWDNGISFVDQQLRIPLFTNENQALIWKLLKDDSPLHFDVISHKTGIDVVRLSLDLFELEMASEIKSLPGKMFTL